MYSVFQLYAETLSWDSDQIGVDPEHPEAVEWKRKEALYNQVLQYFDRGKVCNMAIRKCTFVSGVPVKFCPRTECDTKYNHFRHSGSVLVVKLVAPISEKIDGLKIRLVLPFFS